METLLLWSTWKNIQIFVRNDLFLNQIVIILDFSVEIQVQRPEIDPCTKFHPSRAKDNEARISTSIYNKNAL